MIVDQGRKGKYKCAVYYKGSVKNGELISAVLSLNDMKLWSPDSPYL